MAELDLLVNPLDWYTETFPVRSTLLEYCSLLDVEPGFVDFVPAIHREKVPADTTIRYVLQAAKSQGVDLSCLHNDVFKFGRSEVALSLIHI